MLVEKRKWDGSVVARTSAHWLAAPPGHHCWWTPAGAVRERPQLGRLELVVADEVSVAGPAWWVVTARAAADDEPVGYHVDAALPARADGRSLVFCDLDLDLVIAPGSIVLRDGGDFRRRARELGYPRAVRQGALRACARPQAGPPRAPGPSTGGSSGGCVRSVRTALTLAQMMETTQRGRCADGECVDCAAHGCHRVPVRRQVPSRRQGDVPASRRHLHEPPGGGATPTVHRR